MMKCRGMGAAMRKMGGGMMKPVAMKEGKMVERRAGGKETKNRDSRASDKDMSTGERLKATAYKALNKMSSVPFKAAEYVEEKTVKDPEKRTIKKNVGDVKRKMDAKYERGAYFREGGVTGIGRKAYGKMVKRKMKGKSC